MLSELLFLNGCLDYVDEFISWESLSLTGRFLSFAGRGDLLLAGTKPPSGVSNPRRRDISCPFCVAPPVLTTMFTAGGTPGQPSEGDIQASTERIRNALRQLRLDDMAALALKQHNERGPVVVAAPSWSKQSILNLKSYLMFLVMAWARTFRR